MVEKRRTVTESTIYSTENWGDIQDIVDYCILCYVPSYANYM